MLTRVNRPLYQVLLRLEEELYSTTLGTSCDFKIETTIGVTQYRHDA